MNIAFFGSSLVSSYWNGAATYYRGLVKALAARGHVITFYEPDAYERQRYRDMPNPSWAEVVVYAGNEDGAALQQLAIAAKSSDVLIKASGIGVYDRLLEEAVPAATRNQQLAVYMDVDAPATLERLNRDKKDPFHAQIPRYDAVLTYGGGAPVIDGYAALGARICVPIYNALDPDTHHPAPVSEHYQSDLVLIANRLPDREARIEEFFFEPARRLPTRTFLLGGSGWNEGVFPPNVRTLGHVGTSEHNAVNSSALAVLNVARDSMASTGFSPATRVFEAAGAGACLITDAWKGIELFLEPGSEVLVAQDGNDVAAHLAGLSRHRAKALGRAARRRILAHHTYPARAAEMEGVLCSGLAAHTKVSA